ncbi:hypothetical protein PsorP6_011869 [Peronosclerospora sorghi]|uniref:Uncharacterized protein n=1 Tax=Peronosclerospora sorghi TaxID=230839 RepID=A0ACC0WIE0_9STRA|nr:hypothetical protein PsorP6_011869 [Peronosclerospora sorghi]
MAIPNSTSSHDVEREMDLARNGVSNLKQDAPSMSSQEATTNAEERAFPGAVGQLAHQLKQKVLELLQQFRLHWWRREYNNAETAFVVVNLHKEQKLFESPTYAAWFKRVYKKYPEDPDTDVIKTLFSRVPAAKGDAELAQMLLKAFHTPGKKMALKTYEALLSFWEKQDKSSVDVYQLLKLDKVKTDEDLLTEPLVPIWVDYAVRLIKKEESDKASKLRSLYASLPDAVVTNYKTQYLRLIGKKIE